jgi:hypothetical protein
VFDWRSEEIHYFNKLRGPGKAPAAVHIGSNKTLAPEQNIIFFPSSAIPSMTSTGLS